MKHYAEIGKDGKSITATLDQIRFLMIFLKSI